jgi:hypothetical protein
MTATITENYAAETSPDDFITPDQPPDDPPGDETAGQDADTEAPYGWTRDKATGELRPKMRPGRPKNPPGPEELAAKEPVTRARDRAPKTGKIVSGPVTYPDMPPGGTIARGVNRLYRRAGKLVRAMDYDIGTAIIECTRRDDDDDLTVGEAWEAVCKTNPRIRAWVLNLIKGGAWGDLVMAHAPIALAIMMKPAILRLIPFRRFIESMAERDEDAPEGDLGGLEPGDVEDMADVGEQMAAQAARKMEQAARAMGASADDIAQARAMAEAMAGGGAVPPAFRRQQPQNRSRAQRRGK